MKAGSWVLPCYLLKVPRGKWRNHSGNRITDRDRYGSPIINMNSVTAHRASPQLIDYSSTNRRFRRVYPFFSKIAC